MSNYSNEFWEWAEEREGTNTWKWEQPNSFKLNFIFLTTELKIVYKMALLVKGRKLLCWKHLGYNLVETV